MKKTKKGAASFYVVAFSTLILVIIAASFATIIISEITRTSNDDLAQSAYDSALAGVEDAKLAYATYEACAIEEGNIKSVGGMNCETVMDLMKSDNCYMVANLLGRGDGEVMISEVSSGDGAENGMDQAYTCVKINTDLMDYRASVSSSNPVKLVPVKFKDSNTANTIGSITIHWYSDSEAGIIKTSNFDGKDVVFPQATLGTSAPPTIGISLIQTSARNFTLDSFTMTQGEETNRGTVYLVPTATANGKGKTKENGESYYGANHDKNNYDNQIDKNGFLRSNDKTATNKNLPYLVYCDPGNGSGFICTASIDLPKPIGGDRSGETFLFAVSLPYGGPATSFSMEFCEGIGGCSTIEDGIYNAEATGKAVALSGSQVEVDSTGRANDLFKRVAVRLEPYNNSFPYPLYGIQLLDPKANSTLEKNLTVISEHNF